MLNSVYFIKKMCVNVLIYAQIRQINKVTLGWSNKNGVKTGRVLGMGGEFIKEIKIRSRVPPIKVAHDMYDCIIVV